MKKLTQLLALTLIWSATSRADMPATHGMIILGDKAIYASHLPMFHSPHDYQLILKLSIVAGSTLTTYQDLKKSGESLFTLVPQVLDLSQIIDGTKTNFTGQVYVGHFEQGGKKLGPVSVHVEKVVFAQKLDATAPASNKYLIFGGEGEYFSAHLILGKPNFDDIAAVSQPYTLKFSSCRTRVCADPIPSKIADDKLPLTIEGFDVTPGQALHAGKAVGTFSTGAIDVLKPIYFDTSDLSQ